MNPFTILCAIKTSGQQRMIFIPSIQHAGFCRMNTRALRQKMTEVFPKSDIIIILTRRKFRNIQCLMLIYNTSFRPGSTKRCAGMDELLYPFFLGKDILFFTFFNLLTRIHQVPNACQRRD